MFQGTFSERSKNIRSLLLLSMIGLIYSLIYLLFVESTAASKHVAKSGIKQVATLDNNIIPFKPDIFNLLNRKLATEIDDNNTCSLDVINSYKFQQDHPCVISTIQETFSRPSHESASSQMLKENRSVKEGFSTKAVPPVFLTLLRHKKHGFFVECCGYDTESSVTLELEKSMDWHGVLIKSKRKSHEGIRERTRKSWILHSCLSDKPYPIIMGLENVHAHQRISQTPYSNESTAIDLENIAVQCFPLYSILLASGSTQVDYLSIRLESHQILPVLKTLPFHKVEIKVLAIKFLWADEEKDDERRLPIIVHLKKQGYINIETEHTNFNYIFFKRDT